MKKTNKELFNEFHRKNDKVYQDLLRLALQEKRLGRKGRIALLFEILREKYKLCNTLRAFYSRELMKNEPELEGFFETRAQVSA